MQVWNRKELIEVPEVGLGAIRFTYHTAFGRILAKGILCRKFVSNVYGAWQKSRLSRGKVEITLPGEINSVTECNLMEVDEAAVAHNGSSFTFEIKPNEVRSFRIK